MSSDAFFRAMRVFDEIPGATVTPVTLPGRGMGRPSINGYRLDLTDESRAMVAEMMGTRPLLVERVLQDRIARNEPLFRNKVTELPNEEGNR